MEESRYLKEQKRSIDFKGRVIKNAILLNCKTEEGGIDAVSYKPQSLTDAQKAQARANIDGASASDLAAEIARSVNADTILQQQLSAINTGSYVTAWNGNSVPVVENIPAGVVVTYNGTTYTGTLAASASTAGRIYIVAVGDEYNRYMSALDTSNHRIWISLGSTRIQLDDTTVAALVEAENARVEAENTRIAAEERRVAAEESRHNTITGWIMSLVSTKRDSEAATEAATEAASAANEAAEKANEAAENISQKVVPYIGANGHWFIYDVTSGEYVDSGKSSIAGYVMAWDGKSVPVVDKIPKGVSVEYNGGVYSGELEASIDGIGVTYLVGREGSETMTRYTVIESSGVFVWSSYGTTEINLSDYMRQSDEVWLTEAEWDLLTVKDTTKRYMIYEEEDSI